MHGRGLRPLRISMGKQIRSLTLCSVLAALGVVMLYLGSLIEVMDLTTVFLASFLVVVVILELKAPWHFLLWAVTSLLSLLLLPNKFCAFEYAIFGGLYPILKFYYEKCSRTLANVLKILSFNVLFFVAVLVFIYLFGLEEVTLPVIGTATPVMYVAVMAVLANVVFVLYDILLTRFIIIYEQKYRKRLKRIFK